MIGKNKFKSFSTGSAEIETAQISDIMESPGLSTWALDRNPYQDYAQTDLSAIDPTHGRGSHRLRSEGYGYPVIPFLKVQELAWIFCKHFTQDPFLDALIQ
jgi:hypothetical protein